jgi:hypothetical protein
MNMRRRERNKENSRRFRRRSDYRIDFQVMLFSKIGIDAIPVMEKPEKGSYAMDKYYQTLDKLIETYLDRYYNMRFKKENVGYY